MNYTNVILKIVKPSNRGINTKIINKITKDKYPNIYNYILSIYPDSISIYETLRRLILHIDIKPVCPTCGKPVNFIGKPNKMFSKYCSNSCRAKDPKNYNKWQNAQKQYNKEKYGVEYNWQREDVKNKRKNSLIKHYGTLALLQVPEIKEKAIATIKKNYGEDAILIKNKRINTNLLHYGFTNVMKSNEIKEKRYNTLRKNKTWNTSKPEEESYILLKEKYPDVIRQYKSELYPFNCDFYIPSLDLYIECNYSWTHGYHPFNENNKTDIDTYNELNDSNSKYRKNAAYNWRYRDVKKREIAKQNKLNYIEFWNIIELQDWLINEL